MQLHFTEQEQEIIELQALYNKLPPEESLFMSHYQLAEALGKTADHWKLFLMHPKVAAFLRQELELFKEHQLKQMIKSATDNDRSVGAAQMINSLTKALNDGENKEGPIIIYTYVPLTVEQELGTPVEVQQAEKDLFALGGAYGLRP